MGKVNTNCAANNQRATTYCTNPILWAEKNWCALIKVRFEGGHPNNGAFSEVSHKMKNARLYLDVTLPLLFCYYFSSFHKVRLSLILPLTHSTHHLCHSFLTCLHLPVFQSAPPSDVRFAAVCTFSVQTDAWLAPKPHVFPFKSCLTITEEKGSERAIRHWCDTLKVDVWRHAKNTVSFNY